MSEDEKQPQRKVREGAVRGRPGRRSLEERTEAVLALLAGKATVAKAALTRAVMQKELMENMAKLRGVPSLPTRSRK